MASTLSILTFPQRWKDNKLTVRAVIIPRNIDPTIADQIAMGTPAWGDAVITLKARLISDPEKYPSVLEADQPFPFNGIAMPANTADIFNEMATQLGGIQSSGAPSRLQKAESFHRARKYLPESYRNAFNLLHHALKMRR